MAGEFRVLGHIEAAGEFRVLGHIEALVDGKALEVGPLRQQSALAVLLTEANRVVAVDQLVERI